MKAPSQDICEMLEGESALGLTFATDLFAGKEYSSPDNCVTVFDTPGRAPQLTSRGSTDGGYYYPSVQVRVRNNNYVTGWDLINEIKEALHAKYGVTYNGSKYDAIICTVEPFLLDWDENDRARFVSTFSIRRKEV